jgi:hypothetical protein
MGGRISVVHESAQYWQAGLYERGLEQNEGEERTGQARDDGGD